MHDNRGDDFTELLAQRLPQHPASLALKRKLAAQWAAAAPPMPWWRRRPFLVPALAAALVLLVALPVAYDRLVVGPERAHTMLVAQAVEGHVRTTQSPLGIESSGQHDVKPWFTGKLDFAPATRFMGDDEFPLRGGSVTSYADRQAAVLVFGRRKHTISLLVFRADGLALPPPERTIAKQERGFNVVLWRQGDLGYALVSDVDRAELFTLAEKLGRS